MADINTTLGLDIDEAFRDLDRLGDAIDRALGRVEIRVDPTQAQRQLDQLAQDADRALSDVDVNIDSTGAARLNEELAHAERNLTDAEREARQLERTVGRVDTEARQVDNTTKGMAGNFRKLEDAAKGVVAAFAAIGVGALFGQAIRGANAAVQSFAQLEDSINAVNVIFGQGSAAVLKFGETAAASAGLSQQAFNQAVTPIGSLLQNFGFDAREAADASVILVQRAADLASVLGGSVQDALLAVGAALRGEADPLERYGASISAIRVEQFALAEGLAATKAQLTPAILLQARYGLILADTARVAGDFSNTAGDLANAQRSASAAVQNFVAEIGEQLAPALAAMVSILPDVLAGIRQLVPGFAAAADSAAAFFNEINEGSGGFREPIQTVSAGLGLLSDAFLGFGDIIQASFDFTAANRQLDQFNTRIANTTARIGANFLARELDAGTDKALAFANALSFLAREQNNIEVFSESFRAFAFSADLTAVELQNVTKFMLDNAVAAGLDAGEIEFLNLQYAILRNTLTPIGNEVAQAIASMQGFNEPLKTQGSRFTVFINELEEIPGQITTTAGEIQSAMDKVGEALNPFDEAQEDIDISAKEFFANLVEEINKQAEFQAGIAELIIREQFDLAAFIGKEGPAAQKALDGFLANINLAEAADRALAGEGTAISAQIGEELRAGLAASNLTADMQDAFITLINEGIFTNSQVQDAIFEGTGNVAADTMTTFREQLELEGAAFDASFLAASVGAAIGASLDFSDQAAAAAVRTVNAYEDAFRDQFEISSPSKLMIRLGEQVVAGFLQGADMGDLQLKTPQVGITGTATSTASDATSGVAGGGGIHVELTTINPIQQDVVSDTARQAQLASSIAASYRSVVPNGM